MNSRTTNGLTSTLVHDDEDIYLVETNGGANWSRLRPDMLSCYPSREAALRALRANTPPASQCYRPKWETLALVTCATKTTVTREREPLHIEELVG